MASARSGFDATTSSGELATREIISPALRPLSQTKSIFGFVAKLNEPRGFLAAPVRDARREKSKWMMLAESLFLGYLEFPRADGTNRSMVIMLQYIIGQVILRDYLSVGKARS